MTHSSSYKPQRIAWIGTGIMGAPMAEHLIHAGHHLTIYTRTKSKAESLLSHGASWADSPANAANGMDIAISMVGYPEDVETVYLGDEGTLSGESPPKLVIDMTTTRPSLAVKISERAKKLGVGSLDAPVSGGDVGARNATLSIMVGGEKEHFSNAKPIFSLLGKQIVHHGPAGSGQHAKIVNQVLIATNMIGVCEGLLYARKTGLDPMKVIESVGSGAAGSWTINNLGPRMIQRDFEPGFFVEHFIKDLRIALEESDRLGLKLPGLQLAEQLYAELAQLGHDRKGTQALLLALEQMNQLEPMSP